AVVLDALCDQGSDDDSIAGTTASSNSRTASYEPCDLHGPDARDLIVRRVERIVAYATEVEITFRAADSVSPGSGSDKKNERILRVALEPRRHDRKAIIVSADDERAARNADHALVLAVARGRAWVRALRQGE